MIFTWGLNLGGKPKCRIQLSLAPSNTITSACNKALEKRETGITPVHQKEILERSFWYICTPGPGRSNTVRMVIRQYSFPHRCGKERDPSHLHQLPDLLLCPGICRTCSRSQFNIALISFSCEDAITLGHSVLFCSPLPMMIRGLWAALSSLTVCVISLLSAWLTGGAGQQETNLEENEDTCNAILHISMCNRKQWSISDHIIKYSWLGSSPLLWLVFNWT